MRLRVRCGSLVGLGGPELAQDVTGRFWGRAFSSGGGSFEVDNPFDGSVTARIKLQDGKEVQRAVAQCDRAQKEWRHSSIEDRVEVCRKFLGYFEKNKEQVATDISKQMGKPFAHAKGEMSGLVERSLAMMELAPSAMAEKEVEPKKDGFERSVVREPVGVVLTLAPWNFPLLTAVNSIVPAVLAGNGVVVNHGFRTPLVADHFAAAFEEAGVPKSLVVAQHCDYDVLHEGIKVGLYDFVSFTGSVPGGVAVQESVAKAGKQSDKFLDVTLELGGNDGAFVASDADMQVAVETIVDGALFNAGQSCCGMERTFVHESLYDEFVDRAREEFQRAYGKVGDPFDSSTNMGPMAQSTALSHLAGLVEDARAKGASVILGGETKPESGTRTPRFFTPTLLADCNLEMECMVEESFGPILAVQKVKSMQEAVHAINASRYGLTAAIFTKDTARARDFAKNVNVGTVFMNRADYLDPYMPWQGRKATGKGMSLSHLGFNSLTRVKNYHFKLLD